MAARGLRVLGLAQRVLGSEESEPGTAEAAERDLVFLGFAGLEDPQRAEAPAAVRTLRGAGVRVLMVTGAFLRFLKESRSTPPSLSAGADSQAPLETLILRSGWSLPAADRILRSKSLSILA